MKQTFVVAKRFIRTLRSKIYKYMTLISKNVYIEKLDYSTIKIKPANVKSRTYTDCKGYLCYKTITFQNVSSEAQTKNFFYFVEKSCSII